MITRMAVGKHKKKAMFRNVLGDTVSKLFCLFRDLQVCYFSQENVETFAGPPHLTLTHALLRKALGDTSAIAPSLPYTTGRKTPGGTLGNIARGGKGLALKHAITVVIITGFFSKIVSSH